MTTIYLRDVNDTSTEPVDSQHPFPVRDVDRPPVSPFADLPSYAQITARGVGWQAMTTTAGAALVVRPSTVALATLFNNNPVSDGVCLIIDAAFAHNLVGVANSSYGIWLCVHPVGMAAPTNDITVRNSLSGLSATTPASKTLLDAGATVLDDGWFPWGDAGHAVTVTVPGGQVTAPVDGRIIVPPTAAVSMTVVADTTGATFTTGFRWYEKKIPLG
jgi:hypothetical protein